MRVWRSLALGLLLFAAQAVQGAEGNVLSDFIGRLRSAFGLQAPPTTPPPTMAPAPVAPVTHAHKGKAPSPSPDFIVLPGTPSGDEVIEEKEVLKVAPWEPPDEATGCTKRFQAPLEAPMHATDLNGMRLPDVCLMDSPGPHHVFAIGDWGGVLHGQNIQPADHRSIMFTAHHRPFVIGADNTAQQNVAQAMRDRAPTSNPDYVLNVGDNFYWGGVAVKCGAPAYRANDASGQWKKIYEDMYTGPGLDGKQWLGVLGNHDYGGWMFTMGWDQAIAYTWATNLPTSTGRWMTPAQYYSAKVRYSDFAIDYYFVDNNVWDAFLPDDQPHHNMCSRRHNPEFGATCGQMGPISVEDCPKWFKDLWDTEVKWLEEGLAASTAEWQVIVTHFPPEGAWGEDVWRRLALNYGIDLIIVGHRHRQSMTYKEDNTLGPTAVIVTGGGGGITSEDEPDPFGVDDQYGFVDLTLSKDEIMVEMMSHKGHIRSTTCVTQRGHQQSQQVPFSGTSLCEGRPPKGPPAQVPAADSGYIAPEATTTVTGTPAPYGAATSVSSDAYAAGGYATQAGAATAAAPASTAYAAPAATAYAAPAATAYAAPAATAYAAPAATAAAAPAATAAAAPAAYAAAVPAATAYAAPDATAYAATPTASTAAAPAPVGYAAAPAVNAAPVATQYTQQPAAAAAAAPAATAAVPVAAAAAAAPATGAAVAPATATAYARRLGSNSSGSARVPLHV